MKYMSIMAALLIWANIWMRKLKFAIKPVSLIAVEDF